ncbi:uncharacterized protein LOC144452174 [Glandiceps talaboti]
MGKAQSKCCGGRKRASMDVTAGDTPEIVPVDEMDDPKKEQPVDQNEEQVADKPDRGSPTTQDGVKSDNKPDAAKQLTPVAEQTAVVEQTPVTEQTPVADSTEGKPTEDTPTASESINKEEETVTVRTVVTEKVIDDHKSTPLIIDTTQSIDTKQLEGEEMTFTEHSSHSETRHQVIKQTIITETVTTVGDTENTESTVKTTETVTENVTVEGEEVIHQAENEP